MSQRQLAFIFCICTYFTTLYGACIQTLAYAIASEADLLNSTCGKDLMFFREAVNERILWSLKVLDSSGDFKPGFLYGNNYWLGSRSQCLDTLNTAPLQISQRKLLNNTLYRDPRREFPPFQINYFVAHFRHNSTIQYHINIHNEDVITLGLCLPALCTTNNLSFILKKIFCDRSILINDLYAADFQLIQVKDLNNDNKMLSNGMSRFICAYLGLSFIMLATGTIYDVYVRVQKNEARNMSKDTGISHGKSTIKKILICFSVYTNTQKIFNTKLDAGAIPAIHGLKFIGMIYMIMFHSLYYTLNSLDNKVWMGRFVGGKLGGYIFDMGLMSVDIYFFASGCLITYVYIRNKKNNASINCREKLMEFFIYIIKRFFRLTPTYMMVLGIAQLSAAWFDKTSLFYINERSHETCEKWWRNLLYINNLYSMDEMCMSWSWYLANDMQFYIIAITLLILSTIYFYVAVMMLSGLLIASIILSGYISYIYEYVPTFDEQRRLADVLYIRPWMRISPYIIGIITGYILTKLKNNLVLKNKIIIFCWCLTIVCNVSVFVVLSDRYNVSVLATSIYVALHRIFWGIGIAWVVIACSTKHGGIVNQLLSFKGWIPLSRLSYCAYLLNPVVIQSIHLYSEIPIHFEFLPMFVMNVGYISSSYLCSYVLSVMVEMPCILLIKIFFKYRNGK